MKNSLLLVLLLTCSLTLHAQVDSLPPASNPGIEPTYSLDSGSEFFGDTLLARLSRRDTTISLAQCFAAISYYREHRPAECEALDEMCHKAYTANEEQHPKTALKICEKILETCPSSLAAHREIALAHRALGNTREFEVHSALFMKLITSISTYRTGKYNSPFILNTAFESLIMCEAAWRTKPKRILTMKDKQGRILIAFEVYSAYVEELFVCYFDMTPMSACYRPEELILESDLEDEMNPDWPEEED